MFGPVQLPFQVTKIDGKWKVVPQKPFEMFSAAAGGL